MSDAVSASVLPQLVVGLGNPGPKYDRTRHNVGFEVLDALAKDWPASLVENKRFHGIVGDSRTPAGDRLVFLKPTTYMNRSGQSVRSIVDWYKLDPAAVLVVYDDMDLPVGRLRLRTSGSAGGHNGMKSIISHLGTQDFPRLRIGIGTANKAQGNGVVSHVLGKFAPEARQQMNAVIPIAVEAIHLCLRKGVEPAMNRYNGLTVETA
ncbi:MAG: aminoacyl-tRNA hydrolase [Cyanobacteria bacterium J06628_6]